MHEIQSHSEFSIEKHYFTNETNSTKFTEFCAFELLTRKKNFKSTGDWERNTKTDTQIDIRFFKNSINKRVSIESSVLPWIKFNGIIDTVADVIE